MSIPEDLLPMVMIQLVVESHHNNNGIQAIAATARSIWIERLMMPLDNDALVRPSMARCIGLLSCPRQRLRFSHPFPQGRV